MGAVQLDEEQHAVEGSEAIYEADPGHLRMRDLQEVKISEACEQFHCR